MRLNEVSGASRRLLQAARSDLAVLDTSHGTTQGIEGGRKTAMTEEEEREEKIRQVREDCCILIALATNSHDQGSFTEGLKSSLMRVLKREQAHLERLLVG